MMKKEKRIIYKDIRIMNDGILKVYLLLVFGVDGYCGKRNQLMKRNNILCNHSVMLSSIDVSSDDVSSDEYIILSYVEYVSTNIYLGYLFFWVL